MKVKFKQGYIGRETAMQSFAKGQVVDLPFAQAQALRQMDIVEYVEEEETATERPQKTRKPKEVTDDTNT